jgi:Right handed beta helix region
MKVGYRCWWLMVVLALSGAPLHAETPAKGEVRIAEQPEQKFASIQAAIDAAGKGDTVLIGPGRYDERLKIGKSLKLVGAGPGQTVIGPTADVREAAQRAFAARIKELADEAKTPADHSELEKIYLQELMALCVAIIKVEDVDGAELRSLTVTSPGEAPDGNSLSQTFSGIVLEHAGLSMKDCAVVGCLGDGVQANEESSLEIDDCLIAGCWNTGVRVENKSSGRLRIVKSDIRNCYYAGIMTDAESDPATIEDCRISGAASHGIRAEHGGLAIRRCAIFENAGMGIYADLIGEITQNLIYRNGSCGVACLWAGQYQVEGNLLLDNAREAIAISGASEPVICRNVVIGSPLGVTYGSIGRTEHLSDWRKSHASPTGKYDVLKNLFWKVDHSVVRRFPTDQFGQWRDEPVALPPDAGNRVDDPLVSLNDEGQIMLAADSPARELDLADMMSVTLKSRWPITPEEQSMIPDDGTRDSRKWKTRPRRPQK